MDGAGEQMDFCLEFHDESELKLAVAQVDQITGLTRTQLSPTRLGLAASFELLLETCEEKAWKRRLKQSDEWVGFTWETRQAFANAYDPLQFFTSAERVYLISVVLAPIKAKRRVALNNVEQHQALHRAWIQSSLFAPQPLDLICNYYGEEIALYFAFLGHYTAWLLPLAVLGALTFAHQFYYGLYSWPSLAFALSAMLWDTLFFESWKRKEKLLAFEWNGMVTQTRVHEIQRELHYKRRIPWVVGYSLSFALLLASFAGKAWLVSRILWLEDKDLAFLQHLPLANKAPSVLLAFAIMGTSQFNRALAVFCTQTLEQRATVEEAKGAIVIKLVLQHFVNSHAVLLYIAFVERDLDRLKSTLMSLVVLSQVYGQVLEVGVPLVQSGLLSRLVKRGASQSPKSALEAELDLVAYSGVFSDYLELWVQMGQIGLYSSVFPLSALASLVNNVMEVKTDAFRLMRTSTRPVPFSKPSGIGNWLVVFEALGFVSLATNAGLAFVLVQHQYEGCLVGCWSDFGLLLVLVAVEHVAVMAKVSLRFFIPDMPKEIQDKVAQNAHRESVAQRQRLEHRIRIQRLVASKKAVQELAGGGGNAALEQEALVEYAVQQTKARILAEEAMRKAELELHKTRQSQGAMHTLGVTVIWLNLAVAALAAALLFSGM